MTLDEPITRPASCLDDATDMVRAANAPMAVPGLLERLAVRWGRRVAAATVQAMLASRVIEWAVVKGRSDCVQLPGWRPEAEVVKERKPAVNPQDARSLARAARKAEKETTRQRTRKMVLDALSTPRTFDEVREMLPITYDVLKKTFSGLVADHLVRIVGERQAENSRRRSRLYRRAP